MARQRRRMPPAEHQPSHPADLERYGHAIITEESPQLQLFVQLMEGVLKKLERYCASARPTLAGEIYLTGEEVCERLKLSTRTLQEYRSRGLLAFYKIGGKILYKQSDLQAMLDRHYNPIQNPSV